MLDVYLSHRLVGHIHRRTHDLLAFRYGEQALDEPGACQLSVRLAVRTEPYEHDATMAFFENLLPEGESRDLIAQARQFSSSDVPGLLGVVGGECAGAVSIWPAGMPVPAQPAYRPLGTDELRALFDRQYDADVLDMQVAERLSMSGAQQKMVFRRRGEVLELPLHGSPSNVIIKRAKGAYSGLVLNELACMWLLRATGFEAAESRAVGTDRLLFESARYDREEGADGRVQRLHQEDFCQATGRRSWEKYQSRGGPAYGEIATVIRRYCTDPLRDLETVARWALFNVLVGNNDAHAKNLSLLYAREGLRLAPVYDVVSTLVYPQIDKQFSLEVGGQRTVEGLHRVALDKFARSLGMKAPAVTRLGRALLERVGAELDPVLHQVASEYEHHPVLDHVQTLVQDRIKRMEVWLHNPR